MRLRLLEADGQEVFRQALQQARNGEIDRSELEYRVESVRRSALPLDHELPDDELHCVNRLKLGERLVNMLADVAPQTLAERGLWTWLATAYFETICPAAGADPPGADARYVLSDAPWRYYRHLVYGPYAVVKAHQGEVAGLSVLLGTPPHRPGDIWEQIASRQDLIASPTVVRTLGQLYCDSERGSAVPGAAAKGPGSTRRFVSLIAQLDCTWDLWELPAESLLDMLPSEFDRFLRRS